ncbi:HEAT repeat-containing protein 5A [Hordeum vulgare]|nr:HEAT repeat-containing protein 5A [Hordeum vulgare]
MRKQHALPIQQQHVEECGMLLRTHVLTIGGLLRPSLRPPLREECALVEDDLRELLAPLHHGLFVHLNDAEAALTPPVLATIHFGDNPRGRREPLHPLPRGEIHVPTRLVEAPRSRVVRAGSLVDGVERAEPEGHVTGVDLGTKDVAGARADAAVARSS